MNQSKQIKEKIKREVIKIVKDKKYIISTTIVGSFINSKGLDGISDIDVVIIVDKLNKEVFDEVNDSFQRINSSEIGLNEYDVIINNTFGPLKFNTDKNIVFHVMIYSIEGHIDHVEQSPFTCISWENYKPLHGISLKEIYPVLNLQLTDILESRRGMLSYISDVENGSITYRKYTFEKGVPLVIKDHFELDSKHKLEYSYHITYHLLNNFYKIITREIDSPEKEDLIEFYFNLKFVPKHNISFFKDLFYWKKMGGEPPLNVLGKTKLFLNDFFNFIEMMKTSSVINSFRRHEKTILNDGTFLGVKRNPSINEISKEIGDFKYEIGYHSELLRSKETINHYNTNNLICSPLLNEINYGKAEGLSYEELNIKHPHIVSEWSQGLDPNFPDGESQEDVLKRVNTFLSKVLESDKNCLVITHLVVLRMILFHYLKIDMKNLYKIRIGHLEGFDVLNFREYFSIETSKGIRREVRKQLSISNG